MTATSPAIAPVSPTSSTAASAPTRASTTESDSPRAPQPASLAVSVVLPTYRRPKLVLRAIDALLAQDAPGVALEVIVVDNAPSPASREAVLARHRGGEPALSYLAEPRLGVAFARNAGIAHARGAIVAFTDDDEEVAPDWVATIARLLREHPDADFVAGRVLPRWAHAPPSWLRDWHWGTCGLMDRGPLPFRVDRHRQGYGWLSSGNLAIRRAALEAVGGFTPALQRKGDNPGSIEDHELVMRLCLSGRHGLYSPELVATADVPAERLTRGYHRQWQARNGHYCAQIGFVEADDGAVRLFGVPGAHYRYLVRTAGRLALALARGRADEAFHHELRLRWSASYVAASHALHGKGRSVREIAGVARVLAQRRWRALAARIGFNRRAR